MSKNSISLKKEEEKKEELILGLKIKIISKKKNKYTAVPIVGSKTGIFGKELS